ncbi:MAG TPA: hypothetical protein VK866_10230 [Acidimicrobiales bacterium]|nr:hypothetical protein [Acidimicrobiales bacterium]
MKLRDALRLGASGDTSAVDDFALSADDLDTVRSIAAAVVAPELDTVVVAGSVLAPVENDRSLADGPEGHPAALADDPAAADEVAVEVETRSHEVADHDDLGWDDGEHDGLDPIDHWSDWAEPDAADVIDDDVDGGGGLA